jgi:hypothetical protein
MLSCKDATQLISKRLDEPLTFWERFGLKLHLAICYLCRRANKQMTFIHVASHEHDEKVDPANLPEDERLSEEAREKIVDACQKESTEG